MGPVSLGINPITGLPVFRGADGQEIAATEKLTREDMVALGHSTRLIPVAFFTRCPMVTLIWMWIFTSCSEARRRYSFSYVREVSDANYNAIKGQVENMWFQEGDKIRFTIVPIIPRQPVD